MGALSNIGFGPAVAKPENRIVSLKRDSYKLVLLTQIPEKKEERNS